MERGTVSEGWNRVKRVLMCPPKYFRVEFKINPYMDPTDPKKRVDSAKAWDEWRNLRKIIEGLGVKVEILNPQMDVPDLVFPADLGFVVHPEISQKTVVLSNFKWKERQKEAYYYEQHFRKKNYKIVKVPKDISFEMNVRETDKFYLLGYGIRNDKEGVDFLKRYFEKPVHALKLVSPWFYHLTCALSALNNDTVMYYPKAFDRQSNKTIEDLFKNRIIMTKKEATDLVGNCIVLNGTVIINRITPRLRKLFESLNINWRETDVDEFIKAGGGANCMVFVLSKNWDSGVFKDASEKYTEMRMGQKKSLRPGGD